MPTFAIDPEIRVRHRDYPVLRSIAEAAEFACAMASKDAANGWSSLLRRLNRVQTEDDALEAAVALEGALERENMLVADGENGLLVPPRDLPNLPMRIRAEGRTGQGVGRAGE